MFPYIFLYMIWINFRGYGPKKLIKDWQGPYANTY